MTDLIQAIAELRRTTDADHPFVASHFSDCSILSGQEQEVATILNAVASDTMIPRADADAELAALRAQVERLKGALISAGAMRDAAYRVSEWFATEARHLEGPRINGLRMAIIAYDRHMQPSAALTEGAVRDHNEKPGVL